MISLDWKSKEREIKKRSFKVVFFLSFIDDDARAIGFN